MSYIKSLSEIEQWGYYEVNNKKYFLLREAYEQVTHVNQIKFNFHDDWFMRMNTSVEPTQSLDELYRQRVQQIRKKYDYVVLAYSGGADSHNILKYFELTDTPLDEIVLFEDSRVRSRDSVISGEVFQVALPDATKFVEKYPATKIRLLDGQEYVSKIVFDKSFKFDPYYMASYHLRPTGLLWHGWWEYFIDDYQRMHSQGKRIGVVWGFEKPKVMYDPIKGYMMRFHDWHTQAGHKQALTVGIESCASDEPFYWTHELPLLSIKQAHLVAKYLQYTDSIGFNPQHGLDQLGNCLKRKSGNFISYEYIHPIIYPYWDINTFTYGKERDSFIVGLKDDSLATANDPEILRYASAIKAIFQHSQGYGNRLTSRDMRADARVDILAGITPLFSMQHPLGIF